jgi:hypothetical protein
MNSSSHETACPLTRYCWPYTGARTTAEFSLSWISYNAASPWPRRNFLSFPNWRNILECITVHWKMKLRQLLSFGSVIKMHGFIVTGVRNCLTVGVCGPRRWLWKSNFMEVNNKVWEIRLFWFYSDVFTYFHKTLRAINFPHTLMQFHPIFCYLPPFRPKCFPQYFILDEPGSMLVPYCETPSFVPV